jgi:hypothetical protein
MRKTNTWKTSGEKIFKKKLYLLNVGGGGLDTKTEWTKTA